MVPGTVKSDSAADQACDPEYAEHYDDRQENHCRSQRPDSQHAEKEITDQPEYKSESFADHF